MEPPLPSEGYLIFHRVMTFLDEWLFYGLLLYLFLHMHDRMMVLAALIGAPIIFYSYKRFWRLEAKRFDRRPIDAGQSEDEHTPA